jgi:UDP-N-acetylmuramate dehydrogenase
LNYILELKNALGNWKVLENVSMRDYTTFRVGGAADVLIDVYEEQDVILAIRILKKYDIPYLVIGNGSNLIVRDDGIEGAVINLGKHFSAIAEPVAQPKIAPDVYHLVSLSGALLSSVAATALDNDLADMSEIAGIPGSVGGAVYMNAGAYGGEVKDSLYEVKVYDTEKDDVAVYQKDALDLSYRHSMLFENPNLIILSVVWQLRKGTVEELQTIKSKYEDYAQRRRDKQPLDKPSAGSFFKRPPGLFAGQLIQEAGLKGLRVGDAQISDKHAGFVVNLGDATSQDILDLAAVAQATVLESAGVLLEIEPMIIGRNI